MTIFMPSRITRRAALAAIAALAALPAAALTTAEADALIQKVTVEINAVINSGKRGQAMYDEFEQIFVRYADLPTIARSTLGPDARRASPGQLAAFSDAFRTYVARKYGRRFEEVAGGRIDVEQARPVKSFYEVRGVARLRGEPPFAVTFLVSDRSGDVRFFDLLIEGISLLKTERTEIGAMLDRRRGDIDALIADLRTAG